MSIFSKDPEVALGPQLAGVLSPQDEVPQGHAGVQTRAGDLLSVMEVAVFNVTFSKLICTDFRTVSTASMRTIAASRPEPSR